MKKFVIGLCWTSMILSLLCAVFIGWLGVAYQFDGRGLTPGLAVGGSIAVLLLGWLCACVADHLEG